MLLFSTEETKYGPKASVPKATGPEQPEKALPYPQGRLSRGSL